jgi:hypothetical protein
MAIPDNMKELFQTFIDNVRANKVALVETKRMGDSEPCFVMCSVHYDGEGYSIYPFAELIPNGIDVFVNPEQQLNIDQAAGNA